MEYNSQQDRIVRWDGIRREQLSYAINLFLILSVGTLGFEITLLQKGTLSLDVSWQRLAFLTSLLLVSWAVLAGLIATITRLCDFRFTAQKKHEEREVPVNRATIAAISRWIKKLEFATWETFWCQVGTYTIGVALLASVMYSIANSKFLG